MTDRESDPWAEITDAAANLATRVKKVASVSVNSATLKAETKGLVQQYFREARPYSISSGIHEADVGFLDEHFQGLNSCASGNNRKNTYDRHLRDIRKELQSLGTKIELQIGKQRAASTVRGFTHVQSQIIATLEKLVPNAALSFHQALLDLSNPDRVSFRGPAVEIREALRETIDHFAPDKAVMAEAGFQFEKGLTKPTTRQKVRFILRSRGRTDKLSASTVDATERIDSGPEQLARSLYTRGSIATHVASARNEIIALQRYTEAVLAELLEIDLAP